MNYIKKSFLILIVFVLHFNTISAEEIIGDPTPTIEPVTIHLEIATNDASLYDQDLSVTACDSDNPSSSNLKVTPYCAILQSGLSSTWSFDWPPGIFLNSINEIAGFTTQDADGNDVYHYWSWSLNGTVGTVGLNQYELESSDLISLTFIDPIETPPTPPEEESNSSGSSGSYLKKEIIVQKSVFDFVKAFDFLISQQLENGSFGENLYTDWTALALATTKEYAEQKTKLTKYLSENKLENPSLTDLERRAMALMSLGANPYGDKTPARDGTNYIQKIIARFDGKQFGEPEQDNDDIFALIVLQNAGYPKNDEVILKTLDFILSKQKENGSWDNNVDLTSAGIQSIATFQEKNSEALLRAKEFLKQNQKEDGGFGNVSSSAWVMGGIFALGEKAEDWQKNDKSPIDYLANNQDTDGGIKNENIQNKLWETAYVLTVLSEKTWNQIMQKFDPIESLPRITRTTVISERPASNGIKIQAKEITASPINTIEGIENNTPQIDSSSKTSKFRIFLNKILGFLF
jgi:hypothetical protein